MTPNTHKGKEDGYAGAVAKNTGNQSAERHGERLRNAEHAPAVSFSTKASRAEIMTIDAILVKKVCAKRGAMVKGTEFETAMPIGQKPANNKDPPHQTARFETSAEQAGK